VRLLERRALQAALEKLPKAQPKRLVMDEFALFKGHRYASVVLDADTRRVLWIGEGRSRAAIRPFFEELGPEGCARIEAVAMDMNTAFDLEVRQHCPQARVVYDLFHVVAKYGRESEIPALKQFAKRLRGYWRGILSRVRWPMHTGQLEGINNRIKVIKRMAYGYRDSEFFFMKIKNDFPGNP